MPNYLARVVRMASGRATERTMPTAEIAAEQLFVLMTFDGWFEAVAETIDRLVAGETIRHKGFEYSVTEEEA